MLEKMREFFERRLDGYEEHMLNCIESARDFYPYTASLLPRESGCLVLDLGCGTGLELDYYFSYNAHARVHGIDLSEKMLLELKRKWPNKSIEITVGSYFDVPLLEARYDAAVSAESLHHFSKDEKIPLYAKVRRSLREGGYFILTDYFSQTPEEERHYRDELIRLKQLQEINDGEFYHFDTPLTVAHETESLLSAGFSTVETLATWGATSTLRAYK